MMVDGLSKLNYPMMTVSTAYFQPFIQDYIFKTCKWLPDAIKKYDLC